MLAQLKMSSKNKKNGFTDNQHISKQLILEYWSVMVFEANRLLLVHKHIY